MGSRGGRVNPEQLLDRLTVEREASRVVVHAMSVRVTFPYLLRGRVVEAMREAAYDARRWADAAETREAFHADELLAGAELVDELADRIEGL